MDSIITSRPRAAIISRAKDTHPHTIAPAPTPPFAAPYVKTSAIVDAATPAMCCQKVASNAMSADSPTHARAIWDTGREGKGLTSLALPSEFSSSCQPGKVFRRQHVMKLNGMEMKLERDVPDSISAEASGTGIGRTYMSPTKTTSDLNLAAA